MSEFIYQEPFPIECDKTQYRLLTKEYVKIVECDGRRILKVDPKGIELLAREAYTDVSFYLRPAHLEQLRHILARTPARPSASARRARMSLRERTTPNVSPGAPTKPTRSATCAIRRWCPSR